MADIGFTGIDPELLSEFLTRALAIDQELNYRLESADMFEEVRLLREQARCCFRSLAQVQNYFEAAAYSEGRVHETVFSLSELIEDVASMVRSKTRSAKITIESEIEKGIFCKADPERLSACIVNLIVNALQNVDQDSGMIKVSVKRLSGFAAVSICDNGYGMTNQELSKQLEREDGSRGFDILKKFCASVGTTPLFETKENDGFSVTVRIPLAPPSESIKLHSDVEHIKMGTISPCTLLIYKYDGASVVL